MATSGWLDMLGRDLRFTRRVLAKNVAFTATAIVTLALGIAASTVIFSVVDTVLLKPLDYNDSGDIYRIYDPAALIPSIRRELASLDPTIPAVFAVYSDVIAASLPRHRLGAVVVARALQLAGIGVVFGIAGAIAMRQVVASQLYEVSALDPWVLAIVPLTMLGVTLVASYLPARRASRIDVCAALREN